jgi:hypothetical protein
VHVDPDRDPTAPFADRLELCQAVTLLAPSRMSKPSTLSGAHSVIGSSVVGVRQVTAGSWLKPANGSRMVPGFAQELKAYRNFESRCARAATLQI